MRQVAPNSLTRWSIGDIISPNRLKLINFSDKKNCKYIFDDENYLTKLPKGIFDKNTQLRILRLNDNKLPDYINVILRNDEINSAIKRYESEFYK